MTGQEVNRHPRDQKFNPNLGLPNPQFLSILEQSYLNESLATLAISFKILKLAQVQLWLISAKQLLVPEVKSQIDEIER